MKLELDIFDALCATVRFTINGIEADPDDFGEKYDRSPDTAEDYGCGDMQFTPIAFTEEVLSKYQITEAEYAFVAQQLQDGLSFGSCGWCV